MRLNPARFSGYRRFWDEERETLPIERRRENILQRVQHQLEYAEQRIPFYQRYYREQGFRASSVRSLEDFTEKVPVVKKDMLRSDQLEHPPFGSYLGIEEDEIFRIHGSSGTTGTPTMYGISRADWDRAAQMEAMALWAMGVRPSDRVQLVFPFSLFIGGWAILLGCETIGATCFPIGNFDSRRQVELLFRLGTTVVAGTPSYAFHLAEVAKEMGLDVADSKVEILVVGGEPGGSVPNSMRALSEIWGGATVCDTGNTSECFPTQMNSSCHEMAGTHIFDDEVFAEITAVDDPHRAVPVGARGAVVYTTLWRESQPMIRFWVGDETYVAHEPCACGRTYPRMPEGLLGRIDDMLIVRGLNVYPSNIENVLRNIPGIGLEFRIVLTKRNAMDELTVVVEREDKAPGGDDLRMCVTKEIRRNIHLRCEVDVVKPNTLERTTFKAKRVIDRRSE